MVPSRTSPGDAGIRRLLKMGDSREKKYECTRKRVRPAWYKGTKQTLVNLTSEKWWTTTYEDVKVPRIDIIHWVPLSDRDAVGPAASAVGKLLAITQCDSRAASGIVGIGSVGHGIPIKGTCKARVARMGIRHSCQR